jgi:hypothetical protein
MRKAITGIINMNFFWRYARLLLESLTSAKIFWLSLYFPESEENYGHAFFLNIIDLTTSIIFLTFALK